MGIRVTQETTEALVQPTTQKVRATQALQEVLVLPTSQRLRATQHTLEVLVGPPVPIPGATRAWASLG